MSIDSHTNLALLLRNFVFSWLTIFSISCQLSSFILLFEINYIWVFLNMNSGRSIHVKVGPKEISWCSAGLGPCFLVDFLVFVFVLH